MALEFPNTTGSPEFRTSRLKIERAKKHISELEALVSGFDRSGERHRVSTRIIKPEWLQAAELVVDLIEPPQRFLEECSPIVGDALHNLRSAMDILYCEAVELDRGRVTNWTKFPVCETREGVVAKIQGALKQKTISPRIAEFIVNVIKPYPAQNPALWFVHEMDILDKHKKLVPAFQVMALLGVRLQNEEGRIHPYPPLYFDTQHIKRLEDEYGRNPRVHDQGRIKIGIAFREGTPYADKPIVTSLTGMVHQFSGTITRFQELLKP